MKAVVQVKNLQKCYRKCTRQNIFAKKQCSVFYALNKISFDVQENEIFGIIGPNGSGKSTLIRILSTLLLPDRGSAKIFGFDVVKESSKVKDLINRVHVEASFFKMLSAKENLIYSAKLYGENLKTAELKGAAILEQLGLPLASYDEPLENMSRGMQQKIAVTRALLSSPKLVLFDEPTTGLDPSSKKIVQNFILDLKNKYKTTVIITSHDMQEIERLCDRVAFLDKGSFIEQGTIPELKEKFQSQNLEEVFMKIANYEAEDVDDAF